VEPVSNRAAKAKARPTRISERQLSCSRAVGLGGLFLFLVTLQQGHRL